MITYSQNTGNIFGSFKTNGGKSFSLEKCQNGYVWKEYEVGTFGEDVVQQIPSSEDLSKLKSVDAGARDSTTVVTYSVQFYYTPQFAAITSDIPGYIDQVIAETNQGYANSQIPVRVSRFCIEAATIDDIADTSTFISTFANMKGSSTALRNTADAAALLAEDFNSCGVAYLATYNSGNTISIATKSCALGYFSFGHELGHNFGAHHNVEVASNSYFSYGHGHHIEAGSASTGYRTILAYTASGHRTRVNYYSNPSVVYPVTGTPTGVADISNNAAVITNNRFAFAALGDESGTCSESSTTTTTATPTTTTGSPGNSTGGSSQCGNCVFPFIINGRQSDRCSSMYGIEPFCATSVDSSGNYESWEYCTDSSCPGLEGNSPAMSVHPQNEVGSCCKFCIVNSIFINIHCLPQTAGSQTELTRGRGSWAARRPRLASTPGRWRSSSGGLSSPDRAVEAAWWGTSMW